MSDKPYEIVTRIPELLQYEELLSSFINRAHFFDQPILWEYQMGVTGEEFFEDNYPIDLGKTATNLILQPSNHYCRYLFILNRVGQIVPLPIRRFEIENRDFFPIDSVRIAYPQTR
jgi:hypothetical protein